MNKGVWQYCIILSVLLCTAVIGCKKSDEQPDVNDNNKGESSEYYFRCKIDGVLTEFTSIDSAIFTVNTSNNTRSFLLGVMKSLTTPDHMGVFINNFSGVDLVQGQKYVTEFNPATGVTRMQAAITYTVIGEGNFSSAIQPGKNGSDGIESAEIILSEITDSYVKGTFKGSLLVNEASSDDIKYQVTEGEFKLPRGKDR